MEKSGKSNMLINTALCALGGLLIFSLIWHGVKLFGASENEQETKLVLYEGPKTLKDATAEDLESVPEDQRDFTLKHCVDTKVSVCGQDCYVYDTSVNHSRTWSCNYLPNISRTPITYFDFEGRADIVVTVPERELSSVSISPLSYGIVPKVDKEAHTVSFSVTEPNTYTVMFNNSPERALHIFANPLEKEEDLPDFDDENTLYVGPGEWDINAIMVDSGHTLYISGGAVIHGTVNASFAENIKVMGRGIIDGSTYEGWKGANARVPLRFDYCEGVELEGVIALNPNAWVCQGFQTTDLKIDNIKIVSSRPNGDGITLQSCSNVEVTNCFVRSWDDSLVVKNYSVNSVGLIFTHNQIWTDFAQSIEIGYETNKGNKKNSAIQNVTFSDILVLHNYHKPVISVHNADDASVRNITFSGITVEDAQMGSGDGASMPYLIDLHITQNGSWSTTEERGTISNVLIENVKVISGKFCASRIKGYDEEHTIEGITIRNLEILGQKITDFETGKFEIDEATTANLTIE